MPLRTLKITTRLVLISLLSSFLFACVYKTSFSEDSVVVDDLSLEEITKQDNAVNTAVTKLENGDNLEAQYILEQVLRVNPKHTKALLLKKQLTLSSEELFKTTRFTEYKIRSGDSLGSIAKTWLNDSIYFVNLAILNNIKNPKKISRGFLLTIPVIETSPLVKREKRRSKANFELINKQINNKQYDKSITTIHRVYIYPSRHQALVDTQNKSLNLLAKSKVSISEKYRMITQLKKTLLTSKKKFLHNNLQQFIQQQHYSVLIEEFILLFEDESFNEAATKLIEAEKIKYRPKQNSHILNTKHQLIEKLHENAVILRKKQQLVEAAKTWQTILKLQPNNQFAIKYYNRTQKLLERLEKLN